VQYIWGWLIILASVAGNAEFWVILVNRTHSFPIPHPLLRRFRTCHDLAIPGWVLLLLIWTELSSNSLLRGGRLQDQPEFLSWLIVMTGFWSGPLVWQVLVWQFVRYRQFYAADSRRVYDVGREPGLDSTMVCGQPRRLASLWPWNEYCHLEVNTKSLVVRSGRQRPSRGSRTLRILHLSDLHFIGTPGLDYYRFLVQKAMEEPVDVILFTGDLIDDPSLLGVAREILRPLTAHAPCFFILGNHDWRYDLDQIRQGLISDGWCCVTGRSEIVVVAGRRILLAGTEFPWVTDTPPNVVNSGCDLTILLSHSPDQLRMARVLGYDLMLAGHTHGGQVVLPVIGPVYSPSLFGVSHAAGLFTGGPVALHVSRGLGGKDPLRWHCTPELTRLCVSVQNT
jgi:predicted MPP superfamily phosphohydrolase